MKPRNASKRNKTAGWLLLRDHSDRLGMLGDLSTFRRKLNREVRRDATLRIMLMHDKIAPLGELFPEDLRVPRGVPADLRETPHIQLALTKDCPQNAVGWHVKEIVRSARLLSPQIVLRGRS